MRSRKIAIHLLAVTSLNLASLLASTRTDEKDVPDVVLETLVNDLVYYPLLFIVLYTVNRNINHFLYMLGVDTIVVLLCEFLKKKLYHYLFKTE